MNGTVASKSIVREAAKAFFAVVMLGSFAAPAMAQPWPGSPPQYGAPTNSTLRTPLIEGAPYAPAGSAPYEGDPPPVGDGPVPNLEIPGMLGDPDAPPTQVVVPPAMGGDKATVNDAVSGYLTPPPSTQGIDPSNINGSSGGVGLSVPAGTIDGTNSSGVLQAPVGTGNIDAGGGISFSAPTTRWAAQRSVDYGRNANRVNQTASGLADFGELLPNKPNLKMQPQYSQDGPRQLYTPAIGQPVRAGNYPNAQATTDLYGNRTNFNPNYQSQMTIAPY